MSKMDKETKGILASFYISLGIGFGAILICLLGLELEAGATMIVFFVVSIIAFFIMLAINSSGVQTSCPKCGKNFAMVEKEDTVLRSFDSTMNVEQPIKDKEGNITGYYTQNVPSIVYVCDCIDECKFCGHQRHVERNKEYQK